MAAFGAADLVMSRHESKTPRAAVCVACGGTGVSTTGKPCFPCQSIRPTELREFLSCERKHWYGGNGYGDGLPQNESAALGTDVHGALEHRYRHGYMPTRDTFPGHDGRDPIALAESALPFLPERHGALLIEVEWPVPRPWGYFVGHIDLMDPVAMTVHDYKTSSNPRKYGLRDDTLAYDLQAMVYAAGVLHRWPEWQWVNLQWTYIPTRAKRGPTYPVVATVGREHIDYQLQLYDEPAAALLRSRKVLDVEQTQPNAKTCGAYGGCPYLSICSYPQRNPLAAALSMGRAQFEIDRSKERPTPITKQFTVTKAGDLPMSNPDPAILARIQAQIAAQKAKTGGAPAPAATVAPPPVNPALAASQARAAAEPAALPANGAAAVHAAIAARKAAQEAADAAELAAAEAAELAAAEAAHDAAQAATADDLHAAQNATVPLGEAAGEGGYTLYIGCVPLTGRGGPVEYVLADAIVRSAAQSAALANKVQHYRMIDFGKSQAALAFALENVLRGWTGNVVALPGRELDDAMHTLRMYAGLVVQAV